MTSFDDPSGELAALEAHDAGAVEPVERVPVHTVTLTVVCHCDYDRAVGLAKALEYRAGEPTYTTAIAYAVTEHANLSEGVAA